MEWEECVGPEPLSTASPIDDPRRPSLLRGANSVLNPRARLPKAAADIGTTFSNANHGLVFVGIGGFRVARSNVAYI